MAGKHGDMRLQIIILYQHAEKSVMVIPNNLKTSHSTVSRTIARFKESEDNSTVMKIVEAHPFFGERDKTG